MHLCKAREDRRESKYYNLAMGKRPAEELYRVGTDPGCVTNVADDPAYAETKKQLAEKLEKFLRDQKDPRILGNGDVFDHYEYQGSAAKKAKGEKLSKPPE